MNIITDVLKNLDCGNNNGKKLNIFDFDGTVFNSPIPNSNIWNHNIYGKLMGDSSRGGIGWFQHNITLNPEYVKDFTFNEAIVDEITRSFNSDDSITVLLTGRDTTFESIIRFILAKRNLIFDDYGFKPAPKLNEKRIATLDFKKQFICSLIEKYKIDIVHLYDDRMRHVNAFNDFFKSLNINSVVHAVKSIDTHFSVDKEKEIVNTLVQISPFSDKSILEHNDPLYYGVLIDTESRNHILSICKDKIPNDWKIYCHHMTMLFGKNKNDTVTEYLRDHINDAVELSITHIGISEKAMAVKIECNFPVDNKIPHITVAVPKNGRPYESNNITDWTLLDMPVKIFGTITNFYH